MKKVFGASSPVERIRLFYLVSAVLSITMVLLHYAPPVSNITIISIYAFTFGSLRIASMLHKKHTPALASDSEKSSNDEGLRGNAPSVSFLIAAHNEQSVIRETVLNLLTQDYPDYEILVIDDRSADDTAELLRQLESESEGRVRSYSRIGSTKGKAAALNEILPHSTGDIIAILDADARISSQFLRQTTPMFDEPNVGAVQARKFLLNPTENLLTRCQQYEYCMDAHLQSRRDTTFGSVELRGNGMLIRRTVLQSLGLSEQCLAEDLDLTTRMHIAGWNIRYASAVKVYEEGLTGLVPLLQQRIRWTEGSIVRYLENLEHVVFHPQLAFRTKLDMAIFVFEFIAPAAVILESVGFGLKRLTGNLPNSPPLFAASSMLILSLYFLQATFRGVGKFDEPSSLFNSLRGTIMVNAYFSILWPPIVFVLLKRILLTNQRNLNWIKTPHYGVSAK